jgi:hypothetical protein
MFHSKYSIGEVVRRFKATQNTEIRFTMRLAVLSLEDPALQPDLSILWNTSICNTQIFLAKVELWVEKFI